MGFAACYMMPLLLATDFEHKFIDDHIDAHTKFAAYHMMPNAACHMPVGSK